VTEQLQTSLVDRDLNCRAGSARRQFEFGAVTRTSPARSRRSRDWGRRDWLLPDSRTRSAHRPAPAEPRRPTPASARPVAGSSRRGCQTTRCPSRRAPSDACRRVVRRPGARRAEPGGSRASVLGYLKRICSSRQWARRAWRSHVNECRVSPARRGSARDRSQIRRRCDRLVRGGDALRTERQERRQIGSVIDMVALPERSLVRLRSLQDDSLIGD